MQFRRVRKPDVGINIAPLVDVVFLLVIFFAVSTTFLETAGLELELPSSTASAKKPSEALVVSLTQEGTIALDGETVDTAALGEKLRQALETDEDRKVILRADRRTAHGDVVQVMDVIRESGATGLQVDARSTAASN